MTFVSIASTADRRQKLAGALFWAALMVSLSAPHAGAQQASGPGARKLQLPPPPAWGDMGRWDQPQYYATIQLADIDGDGQAELMGRWAGGVQVNHFDTATDSWVARRPGPPLSDSAHWDQPQYYTTIQFGDIDGDGQAELVARGPEGIEAWHYDPHADSWTLLETGGPFPDLPRGGTDATHWDQPQYYTTIHLADIDGQPGAELIGRGADGLHAYRYEQKTRTWSPLADLPELNDSAGWDQPERYSTIQLADIDGRQGMELAVRGGDGVHVYRYDAKAGSWTLLSLIPELNDADSSNRLQGYSTIHLADIDGHPGAELIARAADGLRVYRYQKSGWIPLAPLSHLSDANGWNRPQYGATIQSADVDGQPGAEIIARGSEGIEVWHYTPKADRWTTLRRAKIQSLSDAEGWNVPQQYLTIQAANIDGRSGAEIIGRSATGIETWRLGEADSVATQVTGPTGFPPYNTPPLSDYYAYLSTHTSGNYGNDIRAHYDEIDSTIAQTDIGKIAGLAPPPGVTPLDANWKDLKTQITTELTYVGTTYDWIRGGSGSRTLINESFTTSGFDVAGVEAILTNVKKSTSVDAGLGALLSRMAAAVAGITGFPVAAGIGNLLGTIFSQVQSEGAAPNLQVTVGEVQLHLDEMYTAALNANDATKTALVSNWVQLQAFAQSKVGVVPSGTDLTQMLAASQFQYVRWIWQSITPAVWVRVTPEPATGGCYNLVPNSYLDGGHTYTYPSSTGCGPAWIGMTCTWFYGCNSPSHAVLISTWGRCSQGQTSCPDPLTGPFAFDYFDPFLNQNGWDLPCTGPDCGRLSSSTSTTENKQAIAEALDALRSLAVLVPTTTSDQGAEKSLAGPLDAAGATLKSEANPTRLEFAARALQNFVLQVKALPPGSVDPAQKSHLIAAANGIRGQLVGPPPAEVLHTRHSRSEGL
jgi:hypothetical protein